MIAARVDLVCELAWEALWCDVADRVAGHRKAGRGHLLTEDTVRMETVLALEAAGVPASRLAAEVLAPQLPGWKLDLVVDPPAGVVIEFKYPRGSRTGVSPDTMTFGELVRDFLRVAIIDAGDRWVVQVLSPRLLGYLLRVKDRYPLHWTVTPGATLHLHPDAITGLPRTATRAVGNAAVPHLITARCVVSAAIDDGLGLYAYRVAPADVTFRQRGHPDG